MQDDLARVMLSFADGDQSPIELNREEDEALARAEAAAARGEFAVDADVEAVWARHGL